MRNKMCFYMFLGLWLCLALFQAGCSGLEKTGLWKEPEVAFSKMRLVGVNLEEARLELDLDVTNPNKFSLPYGALEYALEVESSRLFSGRMDKGGTLKAGERSNFTLPVKLKFMDILRAAKNFRPGDGVNYLLGGSMLFNVPIVGEFKLPLKTEGVTPALTPNIFKY
jgi:LEA14-like dessication related protein